MAHTLNYQETICAHWQVSSNLNKEGAIINSFKKCQINMIKLLK